MVVLICGDRNWGEYRCARCDGSAHPKNERPVWPCPPCMSNNRLLKDAIRMEIAAQGLSPARDVIIHGDAKGADRLAAEHADRMGFKVVAFPAEWDKYGKAAGMIRNKQMLEEGNPDLVLAFHPDISKSKGTLNMVTIARAAGKKVEVFNR